MTLMQHFTALLALATAATIGTLPCNADDYPARPVRIIVPFGAGGPTDIFTRVVAEELQKSLHQAFVIENHPGAGTTIGTEIVAKAWSRAKTLARRSIARDARRSRRWTWLGGRRIPACNDGRSLTMPSRPT